MKNTPAKKVKHLRSHIDRAEAERLVDTYSDLILRLSYTYLKSTEDAKDHLSDSVPPAAGEAPEL